MLVYDFEVLPYDWMVIFKDIISGDETLIINDRKKLQEFYDKNKDNLFIGFNNNHYDNYIFKGILLDIDPYYISNRIINLKRPVWNLARWNSIFLNSYDVSYGLGFTSLKENEAYLGVSIDECPISFDHNKPLNEEQLKLVENYCRRDVEATELLFHKTREKFETILYLITTFNLDKSFLSKSSNKIVEAVLGATRKPKVNDEFTPFDFSQLDLKIYKHKDLIYHFSKPLNYKEKFRKDIAGVPHVFGVGGIHGARKNYKYIGEILLLDVASYYPSMMIEYDWFARSISDDKKKLYAKMKSDRVELKTTDKKLADAYKLVLNSTYGAYKYKWGNLYDPKMANNITICGQVLMVDLIENLEPYMTLIQSNTDGIIIIPHDKKKIEEIVKDWEKRTKMDIEFNYGKRIIQKDVNNYIMEFDDGYINTVGGYVAQYNPRTLRRTMSGVDKAVVEYFIHDMKVEYYFRNNNDPMDYQLISKVGRTYDRVFYEKDGVQHPTNFVNRSFAGFENGMIYKQKKEGNKERIANHPTKMFIWNDKVSELDIGQINKEWYVQMAYKRISDYGGGNF